MTTGQSYYPTISVEKWLKQLINEQGVTGPNLLPSKPNKQAGKICNFFDGKQYTQLASKPISVKLTSPAKPSKSNKRYFQDPNHELALFLIVDGRYLFDTCICVVGCYNVPERYRLKDPYLLRVQVHPQHHESHDFDEWLTPLVDQLANLSLKGFKSKDPKSGVEKTYKAHLVTMTDDLLDRTMLLCSHLPKSKTEPCCMYCTMQRKLRQGHERNRKYTRYHRHDDDEHRSHSDDDSNDGDRHSHDGGHSSDDDDHSSRDDDDSEGAMEDCDCQLGYYEPLKPGAPNLKTRKNIPWMSYGRGIFDRLGSLSLPHSLVPDLAHVFHHVMDDMFWLLHLDCAAQDDDCGDLVWDFNWPNRDPAEGALVVDSNVFPNNVYVDFVAFFERYKTMWTFDELANAIMLFFHLTTQLVQKEFSASQLNSLEENLRKVKWVIHDLIKDNDQWGSYEFFHYPMHMLDHVIECIRQVGPLANIMTLHVSEIGRRTELELSETKDGSSSTAPTKFSTITSDNEIASTLKRRMQLLVPEKTYEVHLAPFRLSGNPAYPTLANRALAYFDEVCHCADPDSIDYHFFHTRNLLLSRQPQTDVINRLVHGIPYKQLANGTNDQLNDSMIEETQKYIHSFLWDGMPHLVELEPATLSRREVLESEFALCIGYFRAVLPDGRKIRRALVCKQVDPYTMKGFNEISGHVKYDTPQYNIDIKLRLGESVNIHQAFESTLTVVPLKSVKRELDIIDIGNELYAIHRKDKSYDEKGNMVPLSCRRKKQ